MLPGRKADQEDSRAAAERRRTVTEERHVPDADELDVELPTFKAAQEFVMPFGKYRGKTLDAVAASDDGLRYMDWLAGEMESMTPPADGPAYMHMAAYLRDPAIMRELEDARKRRGKR